MAAVCPPQVCSRSVYTFNSRPSFSLFTVLQVWLQPGDGGAGVLPCLMEQLSLGSERMTSHCSQVLLQVKSVFCMFHCTLNQ